ncbi:immunoglobulin superfamily member 1-like isoform X3 [Podarcis lilfordi]|nr:immunoglobulin superfamily member 1-like isoform X3 [Podarcis lilfordi]
MEQIGRLFVLLASFLALSWMTALADTVAARPSGLWLSLSPPRNTFARGEQASLICSLPEGQRATGFYFYEKRGGVPVMYGQQAKNILEVSTEYLETNKTFLCAYLGEKSSGGRFLSSLSNEVVLSITDEPLSTTPTFSTPDQAVLRFDATTRPPRKRPSKRTKLLASSTSWSSSSQLSLHYSTSTSSTNAQESRKSSTCCDPKSTTDQKNDDSEKGSYPCLISLAIRCGTCGCLLLLVFVDCIYRRKYKDKRVITARTQAPFSSLLPPTLPQPPISQLWMESRAKPAEDQEEVLPPPAPELSIIPPRQTFLQGQRITLKCSPPEGQLAAKFLFYEIKADGNYTRPQEQFDNTLEITAGFQETKKSFVCAYLEENSAGQLSERSNRIEVSIRGHLRPPFFSVSPKLDTYSSGEIVNLTCSAPENLLMSRVLFKKDQWLLHVYRPPSPLASFTYTRRLSPQDSGEHLCTYRAAESSQKISSPESNSIRISVMDPPPAPVLTVDPPSGVVKEGGFLRLTCSAFGSNAEQRFHFYKDGVKISSSSEESLADSGEPRNAFSNASADILVQVTASIHTGGFACRYEQKLSSRWIMSPWSQTVNVTVLPPPAPELSIIPPRQTFLQGQRITLKCSHPERQLTAKFFFYEIKAGGNYTRPQEQLNNTLEITAGFQEIKKTFVCAYLEENSAGQLSERSNCIEVSIIAQLPDSSAPSMGHAWWASLLLIPAVLFAYCCWRKKGILFALGTSEYQRASVPKESKEETSQDMFGLSVPQTTDFQVKSSDVTYATIASPPAVTPSEPTLKDDPISAKDEEVLYSHLLFHPQQRHHEAVQERDGPEVEKAGPV